MKPFATGPGVHHERRAEGHPARDRQHVDRGGPRPHHRGGGRGRQRHHGLR